MDSTTLNVGTVELHRRTQDAALATWARFLAYSARQENGGRITDAKGWSEQDWLLGPGVTLAKVTAALEAMPPLAVWDGEDLLVVGYDVAAEARHVGRRKGAEMTNGGRSTAGSGGRSTAGSGGRSNSSKLSGSDPDLDSDPDPDLDLGSVSGPSQHPDQTRDPSATQGALTLVAQVAAPKPEPAVLLFPTVGTGGAQWPLTRAYIDRMAEVFPGVDVLREGRSAKLWLEANPSRRKTFRGMAAFLRSWMERAQNSGRGPAPAVSAGPRHGEASSRSAESVIAGLERGR